MLFSSFSISSIEGSEDLKLSGMSHELFAPTWGKFLIAYITHVNRFWYLFYFPTSCGKVRLCNFSHHWREFFIGIGVGLVKLLHTP